MLTLLGLVLLGAMCALGWAHLQLSRDLAELRRDTMGKFEDVQAVLNAVDAETDRIAAEIEELKGQIAAGGMTPDQEAVIAQRLDALATRLKGIGKDPENPVPDAEPTV